MPLSVLMVTYVILGDLNCDILHPDKGSREERALMDLMIEYNLTQLDQGAHESDCNI